MLFFSLIFILLFNSVVNRRDYAIIFNRLALLTLGYAFSIGVVCFSLSGKGGCLHFLLFSGLFPTEIIKLLILLITFLILLFTSFYRGWVDLSGSWVNNRVALNVVGSLEYIKIIYRKLITLPLGLSFGGKQTEKVSFASYPRKERSDHPEKNPFFASSLNGQINDLRLKDGRTKDFHVRGVLSGGTVSELGVCSSGEEYRNFEYPLIILFVVTGSVLLLSSNDFISIFLAVELQSYGLYILSTLFRNSEEATVGGLTYFLIGGLSSCFIVFGSALIYAASGTTNLEAIPLLYEISSSSSWYIGGYLNFATLLFTIGFLVKVGAAPFHFWTPDVYDSIPTLVTTFVATVPKISLLAFLATKVSWGELPLAFLITSIFSLIIGALLGLTTFRIKRLIAYSSVSHIGFILLGLGINTIEGVGGGVFYLMVYTITTINLFFILLGVSSSLSGRAERMAPGSRVDPYSPVGEIRQLRGYYYINPLLSLALLITIFSLIGVPPLLGFFAKLEILSAALDNGYILISGVAIITSIVGSVYYLNIIKEVFFNLPTTRSLYFAKKGEIIKRVPYGGMGTSLSLSLAVTVPISILTLILFSLFADDRLGLTTTLINSG